MLIDVLSEVYYVLSFENPGLSMGGKLFSKGLETDSANENSIFAKTTG